MVYTVKSFTMWQAIRKFRVRRAMSLVNYCFIRQQYSHIYLSRYSTPSLFLLLCLSSTSTHFKPELEGSPGNWTQRSPEAYIIWLESDPGYRVFLYVGPGQTPAHRRRYNVTFAQIFLLPWPTHLIVRAMRLTDFNSPWSFMLILFVNVLKFSVTFP